MFVSNLWQVGGFSMGTPVSSTNKTDRHQIIEILLKVALNTLNHNPVYTLYSAVYTYTLHSTVYINIPYIVG
jgi:hypothetical protein